MTDPPATSTTKTITLTGGKAGHTYTLYQVFTGKVDGTQLTNVQWGNGVTDTFKGTKSTAAAYAKEVADANDARATAQALITAGALTNGTEKTLTADGYYRIGLNKDKKQKRFFVHKLVAETFISNPNNFSIINHIDGNKLNNNVNNLEYCTQSHNIKEAYRLKLMKPRKLKVNQYDLSGNFIKMWNSIKDVEVFYNNRHISDCCKGKRKTACGYIWRYAEN